MATDSTPAVPSFSSSVRGLLPRSASVVDAFRGPDSLDRVEQPILGIAHKLATQHHLQWGAENVSRTPDATPLEIATSKRGIDELNTKRVALVGQIDEWVDQRVRCRPDASLHTETIGSVIDRLAIAWVRVLNLTNSDAVRARSALKQLTELAQAYDDLVRDVAAGHRRLPSWRPLKAYRSTS